MKQENKQTQIGTHLKQFSCSENNFNNTKGVKYFYQTPIETVEEEFALNPFTAKIIGSRNSLLGAAAVFWSYRNAQYQTHIESGITRFY